MTLLRNDIYIVQILDGYTDGKPSWRRVFVVGRRGAIGEESAEKAADELRAKNPKRKYRVRKAPRRR
jgi:hypothetical protein